MKLNLKCIERFVSKVMCILLGVLTVPFLSTLGYKIDKLKNASFHCFSLQVTTAFFNAFFSYSLPS